MLTETLLKAQASEQQQGVVRRREDQSDGPEVFESNNIPLQRRELDQGLRKSSPDIEPFEVIEEEPEGNVKCDVSGMVKKA